MSKIKLELTRGEISHLYFLVVDNEETGTYYLDPDNWEKQTKTLKKKLEESLKNN